MYYEYIFSKSWVFWLTVLLLIIFVIWIFKGRQNHRFIGTLPLCTGVNSALYVDPQTLHNINAGLYPLGVQNTHSSVSYSSESQIAGSNSLHSSVDSSNKRYASEPQKSQLISVVPLSDEVPRSSAFTTDKTGEDDFYETISWASDSNIIWEPVDLTPELPEGIASCITKVEHSVEKEEESSYPDKDFSESSDTCTLDLPLDTPPPYKSNFKSRGEEKCCQIMEKIFGKKFITVRPAFLQNPETKRNLEIDCYNHELRLGVEYSGSQHYKWPNYTGMTYEEFVKQVGRDKLKVDLCDKHGVYLITVPYHVKESDIEAYIRYYLPENVAARNALTAAQN